MELREALAMHPGALPSPDNGRDEGVESDEDEALAVAAWNAMRSNPWPISGRNGVDGRHAPKPSSN